MRSSWLTYETIYQTREWSPVVGKADWESDSAFNIQYGSVVYCISAWNPFTSFSWWDTFDKPACNKDDMGHFAGSIANKLSLPDISPSRNSPANTRQALNPFKQFTKNTAGFFHLMGAVWHQQVSYCQWTRSQWAQQEWLLDRGFSTGYSLLKSA